MLGPALRHVLLFARGLFSDGLSLSIGTIADGDYLRRSGNEIIGDTVSGGGAPSAHASTHQNGGADEIATATPGANAIPKANSSGKLAAGWGGAASTLATLNSSSKVVEDPANATATPTASKIPIANGSGKLAAGWGGSASTLASLDSSAQVVEPVNKIRTSAPGSPASGDVWFASPDLRWRDGSGSTQTAMRGSGGGTDNAVLRADGTGNAVQGSSLILGDDGQMDVGDIRTMPHSTVAWNTGVAVVIDVGTLQNGDYDVWVRFWCERITGGVARKIWTEHMAVRRTAGSPSTIHNGSVGSLGSFGPSIAYGWSGDDLTITITSAGSSGKIGYQVTLVYQGDTTT